jgi:phage gp36-like protein
VTIASVAEFRARAPERALQGVSDAFIQAFLDEVESEIATMVSPRGYANPLTFVGGIAPPDLKGHQIRMALWRLMVARGFSQQNDTEDPLRQGYEDAIAYLNRVLAGEININAVLVATARRGTGLAGFFGVATSNPNRGWGGRNTT